MYVYTNCSSALILYLSFFSSVFWQSTECTIIFEFAQSKFSAGIYMYIYIYIYVHNYA